MPQSREAEISANFRYFQDVVGGLMAAHAGEYALIQAQQVVDYFRSASDAVVEGTARFGEIPFSVQRVINRPIDLGFLSHAADNGITI